MYVPAAAYVCEWENGLVVVTMVVTAVPSPQLTVAEWVSSVPASVNDVDTATNDAGRPHTDRDRR